MTDSRVGTYGCAVLALYAITKVQLLAVLGTSIWNFNFILISAPTTIPNIKQLLGNIQISQGAGPALVVAHTLARVTAPYLIRSFDYVDDEQGPKSSFYAFMCQAKHLISLPRKLAAIVFGFSLASLFYGPVIALCLIVLTLCFAEFAGNYGKAKLGGVMGDFLGGSICICELLVLMILVIVQQDTKKSIWVRMWQIVSTSEPIGALCSLRKISDPVLALFRFVVSFAMLKLWYVLVDCLDSKIQKKEPSESDIRKESRKAVDQKATPNAEESPRSEATKVLSLPTSSFQERYDKVQTYLDSLAKPVGSLGTLESWAARLAALQRTLQPDAQNVLCLIFAGDHGAAAAPEDGGEGCSAYPQAVTQAILDGLERGVAGASVLARVNNSKLRIVDVGVILANDNKFKGGKNVTSSSLKLPKGTRNFCVEPAMSAEECQRCMKIGQECLVQYIGETSAKVVVLGEVGIGNTTSSSALIAALTRKSAEDLCGGGAFATRELSESVVSKKIGIVKRALARHYGDNKLSMIQGADALAKLGGSEIASIVGALLEASDRDISVLVDGFIATAAALVAACISPNTCRILFFTSNSPEPGQRAAIEKIKKIAEENQLPVNEDPVLSMHLRMGEATAALLAVPILRSAAGMLSDMATIQDILS